jgi:hypothetical protein
MAFNNSTLTLQDVKDHFIRTRDDNEIADSDVIDAVNDFYSIVQRLERRYYPQRYKLEAGPLSVTSSGYDITSLTNIGSDEEGVVVYLNSVTTANMVPKSLPHSSGTGYYIMGDGKLYLTPSKASGSIYVHYMKKTSRVALTATLSDETLELDQDLERAFREYVRKTFYDGSYQPDLHQQAEKEAVEEITRYFDKPATGVFL